MGRRFSLLTDCGVWERVVSFPSRFWGTAPAENAISFLSKRHIIPLVEMDVLSEDVFNGKTVIFERVEGDGVKGRSPPCPLHGSAPEFSSYDFDGR